MGLVIAVASLAAACSKPEEKIAFDTTLSTSDLMKHVIDPAALALWGRAGTVDTEQGTVDLAPDTEEEWKAAESEAAIVAEAGNLLLAPGRAHTYPIKDTESWTKFAQQMTKQALAVKAATAARDKDKMFETGGDLYQTCVACHEQYYLPFLKEGETANPNAPK